MLNLPRERRDGESVPANPLERSGPLGSDSFPVGVRLLSRWGQTPFPLGSDSFLGSMPFAAIRCAFLRTTATSIQHATPTSYRPRRTDASCRTAREQSRCLLHQRRGSSTVHARASRCERADG